MATGDAVEMTQQQPSTSAPAGKESQLRLLRNAPLLALGVGHGAVDLCYNTLPVFYPLLVATLHLSYASVGALSAVQALSASLGQPFFGWLADRFGSRFLAPLAVMAAACAIALVGFVPSYGALLLVVALLGVAVGAYHPQGAKAASILGGRWRTTALSVYMVFGSAGYSLGPLLAATVFVPAGLSSTVMLLVPGLLVGSLLFATVRQVDRQVTATRERSPEGAPVVIPWAVVAAIAVVIALRAWIDYGLVAFVPLLYSGRGWAADFTGKVLFLILFTMGAGTVTGGWLADRIGRRAVLTVSFLLVAPVAHLFLAAGGLEAMALALVLGFLLGCSVTVTLVSAQEMLPSRMGVASGIAIAFSSIMGSVGVGAQGLLADRVGLDPSLEILSIAALVAAGASLGVAGRRGG